MCRVSSISLVDFGATQNNTCAAKMGSPIRREIGVRRSEPSAQGRDGTSALNEAILASPTCKISQETVLVNGFGRSSRIITPISVSTDTAVGPNESVRWPSLIKSFCQYLTREEGERMEEK